VVGVTLLATVSGNIVYTGVSTPSVTWASTQR
jgi:hypothetical protein